MCELCGIATDVQTKYRGRSAGPQCKEVCLEPEVRKTEGTVYRMDSEARYWVKSRQWTVELVKLVNGIQVLVNQNKFEDPKKGRLISNLNHLKCIR